MLKIQKLIFAHVFYLFSLFKGCDDVLCMNCDPLNFSKCYRCSPEVPHLIYDNINFGCKCAPGFFRSGDICEECNPRCAECTGPSNEECLPFRCGKDSYTIDIANTTCLYNCLTKEDNYYFDKTTQNCKECKYPCKSCFGGTIYSCYKCVQGLVLINKICEDHCQDHFYIDDGTCLPCDKSCKSCSIRSNNCIECEEGYYHKSPYCVLSCGKGMIPLNGTCENCPEGCIECHLNLSQQKICTKCEQYQYLFNNTCGYSCPQNMYPDKIFNDCRNCSQECTKCYGPTPYECNACNETLGYKMIAEFACGFPACSSGTFYNKTTLNCESIFYDTIYMEKDCNFECKECDNKITCLSCIKPYFTLNPISKICYDKCYTKPGFYRDNTTTECKEICGDGKNYGMYACDDGNIENGDGCDKNCQIEEYYECKGGNRTDPDICIYKKQPVIISFKYYGNRTAIMIFDTKLIILGIFSEK